MDKKICVQCKNEKNLNEFNKNKRQKDGLQTTCKNCQKEYIRKNKKQLETYYQDWLVNNKETRNLSNKQYRQNNRQQIRDYYKKYRLKPSFKENRRKYENNQRKISNIYKVRANLRKRIGSFFKGKDKSKSTEKLLGCSYKDLIIYLENKFTDGMNWENYGLYGWHIDHIIPLSSASDIISLEKLCHYSNLQPLWAKDNLSKGNKII